MKKRTMSVFLMLSLVFQMFTPCLAAPDDTENIYNAVYLGVVAYGTVAAADKDTFEHRFSVNGAELIYRVSNANNYAINNVLAEGYVFDLIVEGDTVTGISIPEPSAVGTIQSIIPDDIATTPSAITVDGTEITITENTKVYEIISEAGGAEVNPANLETGKTVKVYGNPADAIYISFIAEPYTAPISGTPGQRTLKNFLATAMEPVGTALYIYGGTWDWQDVGSSNQATSIGLAQTWVDFFQSKDSTYSYRNNSNYAESYYPHKAYNQYYYAGIDCSGYVGWVMYNIMNTASSGEGFVQSSTSMAKTFAGKGYGTWTQSFDASDFKTGDMLSMNGHIWICLGVCDDGSLVIMHSTPSQSKDGESGGGVQISGVGEDENCEAYALAQEYMERYFPAWSERYDAVFKTYSSYTSFTGSSAGKFSWNLDETGVLDPNGYADMSAEEILKDLFNENIPNIPDPDDENPPAVDNSPKVPEENEEDIIIPFDDVDENDWFYDALKFGYSLGILNEISETSFNPKAALTRSMFVHILYTLEGNPALSDDDIDSSIKDIRTDQWFANAMYWAQKQELIKGYGNGLMKPDDSITREQVSVLLYNYARFKGYDIAKAGDLSAYKDSSQISDWAKDAMAWAVGSKIINGRPDSILAPTDMITRAELVQIIWNLFHNVQ